MTIRVALRLFRFAVLCVAAWLLNLAAKQVPTASEIPIDAVRDIFSTAARLTSQDEARRSYLVVSADGQSLGSVLATSPETDDLIGYAGPSNLLIALDTSGQVCGVKLLSSGDTVAHVDAVRDNESFWKRLIGWMPASQPMPKVDAVSGSTLTSLTMAEAMERRLAGKAVSRRFPQPLTLAEVRGLFTTASDFQADSPRAGWHRVRSKNGDTIGYAVRTSPNSDNVRGYRGPSETLAAIAPDGRTVTAIKLRHSYDTPGYVDRVRDDSDYLALLAGRTIDEWAELDFAKAGIEGVSGATQTSYAVAEGLRRRFAADLAFRDEVSTSTRWLPRNLGLFAVIGGAMLIAYTPLRANRRIRVLWQIVLIAGFGLWFGDLLSLALFAGWARNGVPWQTAPALVSLVAVALVTPWTTRRNVYCQHLCPHGAAQEWLGRFHRWHIRLSPAVYRWLHRIPIVLLLVALVLAVSVSRFDLAQLEPFDAWALRGAAVMSALIAVAGLVASLFVPLAYCRFGCPTGALLKFVRSGGRHDQFAIRDGIACVLLAIGGTITWIRAHENARLNKAGLPPKPSARLASSRGDTKDSANNIEIRGKAFGTTWSVKLRGGVDKIDDLRERIAQELLRIETTLSHWRPESATAQFNASETTLETEQPLELITLVLRALELSRATDGAFDITVAPLVQVWGYGPAGPRETAPSDQELSSILEQVGWRKVDVDVEANTLRKLHPKLQIDLGALLQGYAVDRIAELLDANGSGSSTEYLVEVGGELRACGEWTVAIENPINPAQPLRTLVLKNASLATSGIHRSARTLEGRQVHHFLSPKSGRPVAADVQLCSVLCEKCVDADGWATALFVVGLPEALRLADEHGLVVWLLDQNGEVQTNAPATNIGPP